VAAGGYFGRALVVHVRTGSAAALLVPDELLRAYVGGVGLGAWLMHHLGPPGVDALAPAAPLAFVFSPLVDTPLTTSAKFAIVAKSPLTGMPGTGSVNCSPRARGARPSASAGARDVRTARQGNGDAPLRAPHDAASRSRRGNMVLA
jgi:hypothetical protein